MIGIVGAGITGLALAHCLSALGVEYVVLEAGEAAGGVIRTVRADGRVLELGPQRMRMTAELERLVAELGLAEECIEAPGGVPVLGGHDGGPHRVPAGGRAG